MSSVNGYGGDEQSKLGDKKLDTETKDKLAEEDVEKPLSELGDDGSIASQAQSVKRVIDYGLVPENENTSELSLE